MSSVLGRRDAGTSCTRTTIYSFDPDPIANFPQAVESDGVTGALLNVFGTHVEYLGLTPQQIADATTSTDGD